MELGQIDRSGSSSPLAVQAPENGELRMRRGLRNRIASWASVPVFVFALVAFAAIAPTLPLLEFSGGMENANVATALEAARDGHWWMPTFNGEPRTEKPPLAEWVTAWGILSSRSLAWGARWPTLVLACLTIVGVGYLAQTLGGPRVGMLAAVIFGTTGFFLKFARQASYDMPLTLWVVFAQLFVARAVFRRDWLRGGLLSGACLGLAVMTKGPVALLEVVVPALVYVAMTRGRTTRHADLATPGRASPRAGVALGTCAFLLVATPWTVYAYLQLPGRASQWVGEVTLRAETVHPSRGSWYSYVCVLPHMLPWTVWLFAGGTAALIQSRPSARRVRLAVCWFLVPLFVMSFFPERRDRYALPMSAAGSVLAAWGLLGHLRSWHRRFTLDKVLVVVHWTVVVLLTPAIAAVAVFSWRTVQPGRRWSIPLAVAATVLSWVFAGAAYRGHRRNDRRSLLRGTAAVMLLAQAFFVWCYRDSEGGRSAGRLLVQAIHSRFPNAIVYNPEPGNKNLPAELSIYFNTPLHRVEPSVQLTPADVPRVVLRPADSVETRIPTGFEFYKSYRANGRWFHAYVMPGRSRAEAAPLQRNAGPGTKS